MEDKKILVKKLAGWESYGDNVDRDLQVLLRLSEIIKDEFKVKIETKQDLDDCLWAIEKYVIRKYNLKIPDEFRPRLKKIAEDTEAYFAKRYVQETFDLSNYTVINNQIVIDTDQMRKNMEAKYFVYSDLSPDELKLKSLQNIASSFNTLVNYFGYSVQDDILQIVRPNGSGQYSINEYRLRERDKTFAL